MPWAEVDQRGLLAEMRQNPCAVCGASGFEPCKGSMRKKSYICDGLAYMHVQPVKRAPNRRKVNVQEGLPLNDA